MGRGATKAAGNVWYEARMEAAKWNKRLNSRIGAAEAMNISPDVMYASYADLDDEDLESYGILPKKPEKIKCFIAKAVWTRMFCRLPPMKTEQECHS